ncbi:ABC transporter ATP-binding protein [Nocardioides bruguierae]|uniref:ATP-binding cassette domain-containing protein n=1 Tax=Nocardioides bruguierae TaxID=2945102 RepID=A0A9X2IEV9_9ACTN|nr:ABC transporter ATP-binding protein [Nocardioides bruguierae]MCM0619749.1 ATP-binding cassette domain-containing protein [Nocardioides bruguierae]
MSAPLLELRGITFSHPATAESPARRVLSGVDLVVEEGELTVLAGPTGVGKSTLLGVVAGQVPRFTGGVLAGDVLLDGASVLQAPPRERAHLVGYVGQDPALGFVTDTVEEELAYGMEQLGVAPGTMRRRVEETLDLLGIADLRARALRTLSGGQQQRVAVGAVLTMHPRLLVLDEPTSALDPTAAEEVLSTLTRLVHDLGTSVLVAEHRLERVVPFADTLALLGTDGHLDVGAPAGLLATAPVAPPLVELGRAAGWSPLPLSVRDARRRARGLTTDLPAPATPVRERPPGGLGARDLTVTVGPGGRHVAVRELDLDLPTGRVTALMGRNGAGKSTLLWTLQGTRERAGGSVVVVPDPDQHGGGTDPARLPADARRGLVGLLPQDAGDLLYLETVAEELASADREAEAPGTARALLDTLAPGVRDEAHPRDLSEGQRLALALVLVLVPRPPVLLLDEPTRGLDYRAKGALAAALRSLADEGRAVLVATHDVEFAALVADDAVVMAEGEVVSAGPARAVLAESPAFSPQVTKVLGAPWLVVDEVRAALAGSGGAR